VTIFFLWEYYKKSERIWRYFEIPPKFFLNLLSFLILGYLNKNNKPPLKVGGDPSFPSLFFLT
jgi:hypothetical protein